MPCNNPEDGKAWYEANKETVLAKQKEFYANNKEIILERNKAWREKNKDKVKEIKKKWSDNNKEARRSHQKAYRDANKEKIRASNKEYREANKEAIKEKAKAYGKANKDKRNVNSAKRRALKFRATIRLIELDKFIIDEMYSLAVLRTEQTGIRWHVDHIVPLTKGGLHKPTNLQVVPGSWNESKGNKNCDVYNRIVQNGY